jgi:hypothetical protein
VIDPVEFGAADIQRFLEAVDRHLQAPARLVIIGGSAAALAFGVASTTEDIDTENRVTDDVRQAIERAADETRLAIPVTKAGIAEYPFEYESRLEPQLPHLTNLRIWTLERHDLALSKALRGDEHDFQQIREIHAKAPLDFTTIVERFKTEMKYANGDPRRIRSLFLEMIASVFGELKRVTAERMIPVKWT